MTVMLATRLDLSKQALREDISYDPNLAINNSYGLIEFKVQPEKIAPGPYTVSFFSNIVTADASMYIDDVQILEANR